MVFSLESKAIVVVDGESPTMARFIGERVGGGMILCGKFI